MMTAAATTSPNKYERIWQHLCDAGPDQWVKVEVANPEMIATIINMVQQRKSTANVTRKRLDLPRYGRLAIKREPENKRVFFKLMNAGALL